MISTEQSVLFVVSIEQSVLFVISIEQSVLFVISTEAAGVMEKSGFYTQYNGSKKMKLGILNLIDSQDRRCNIALRVRCL